MGSLSRKEITAIICRESRLWQKEGDYNRAWEINYGDCEFFAEHLAKLIPGAEVFWDEQLPQPPGKDYPGGHAFIRVDGLYYDSERPRGVRDWWRLPSFARWDKDRGFS